MKVTFVSNYINHHQMPFSNAMYDRLGGDYTFIQTEPMEEERVKMGWGTDFSGLKYLKLYYEAEEECRRLIMESDIVIFGGTDDERLIEERLEAGRIVFRYSERLYKSGRWKAISPRGLIKKYHDHTRYRNAPVYMLCAGAYVAGDFRIVWAYPGKMYRWGYFPEVKKYDVDELMRGKQGYAGNGVPEILWAARFIDWKHPEVPVLLAERLKKEGCPFRMTMIGGGEMEEEIHALALEKGLDEEITFTGYKKPADVRKYMERADIYLVTSDFKEGWGAVVNEAMNSGCAVVASHAIGAAPYMIEQGNNGFMYRNGNMKELFIHVEHLLADADLRKKLGEKACKTVSFTWNAQEAADRLLVLCEQALAKGEMWLKGREAGKETSGRKIGEAGFWNLKPEWGQGPCSKAVIIGERNGIARMLTVMEPK